MPAQAQSVWRGSCPDAIDLSDCRTRAEAPIAVDGRQERFSLSFSAYELETIGVRMLMSATLGDAFLIEQIRFSVDGGPVYRFACGAESCRVFGLSRTEDLARDMRRGQQLDVEVDLFGHRQIAKTRIPLQGFSLGYQAVAAHVTMD